MTCRTSDEILEGFHAKLSVEILKQFYSCLVPRERVVAKMKAEVERARSFQGGLRLGTFEAD